MDDVSKMDDTKNPDIDGVANYMATLPVAKSGITSFLDIKFGDITNSGNSVLCLAVPFATDLKSTFYVMDRGAGSLLTQSYKLEESNAAVKQIMNSVFVGYTYNFSNSTITVVRTPAYYLPQIIFFRYFFLLLQCFVGFLRIYE